MNKATYTLLCNNDYYKVVQNMNSAGAYCIKHQLYCELNFDSCHHTLHFDFASFLVSV